MAKHYSHSKIGAYEQCPLKFKYKYIDKVSEDLKTIEAHLGSCVHNTLEWLYIEVKKERIPDIDEIISYYTKNWTENFSDEIKIIKEDFTFEDYFSKGVEFLLEYYSKHKPFDDNTLEVEKKILINLDEDGEYKIIGYIDRLSHNPEKNEYEVHDYKTSNNMPSREQIENDRQLALYSIAIKELFGEEVNVCLTWHYLAHNQKVCSFRTNEQLRELKKEILEKIKEIESTNIFPYNKTVLCNWCGYKGICPAWK